MMIDTVTKVLFRKSDFCIMKIYTITKKLVKMCRSMKCIMRMGKNVRTQNIKWFNQIVFIRLCNVNTHCYEL